MVTVLDYVIGEYSSQKSKGAGLPKHTPTQEQEGGANLLRDDDIPAAKGTTYTIEHTSNESCNRRQ